LVPELDGSLRQRLERTYEVGLNAAGSDCTEGESVPQSTLSLA
jgi:hypothetical protein